MKKTSLLAAALLTGAAVFAQTFNPYPVSDRYQLEALGMSHNHRYITGLNVASFRAFIWDTQEGTVTENNGDYANCDFRCITDNGVAFGILGSEDMVTTNAASFNLNGKVRYLEGEMSQAYATTPDGSTVVGCLLDEVMWWPSACIWWEGERIMLPTPTKEECGIDNDGANAQFISADGKVIAGYLQDWSSSRPAIIWRMQEDGEYEADVISKDLWELRYGMGKPYLRFEPLGLSSNGKWLCLSAQREASGSMPTPEFMVRMNLETGEITESVLPDIEYFIPETDNIYPVSIADDGTCVGSISDELGFKRGVIWKAGQPAPQLLADAFPDIPEFADYDCFMHLPIAISADGKYIAGYACPMAEEGDDYNFQSYLLTLPGADGIASIKTANLGKGQNYNLAGQRLPEGSKAKGIVIEDGRKVLR